MALSRLAFGESRSLGQVRCTIVCGTNVRPLSTGPQPPDPKSHYFGHWNVSERNIQRPHIKYLRSKKMEKPYPKAAKERRDMRTTPRNRFLVKQRLLEMDESGETVKEITKIESHVAEPVEVVEQSYWERLRSAIGMSPSKPETEADTSAVMAVEDPNTAVDEKVEEEEESAGLPGVSLFSRNYRPLAPYEVDRKLYKLVKEVYSVDTGFDGDWTSLELTDLTKKFEFLSRCGKQFDAIMSNSWLNEMRTVGDVLEFYKREPEKMVFYKNLNLGELPQNVKFKIKREYLLREGDLANQDEYRRRKASWGKPKLAEGAHA